MCEIQDGSSLILKLCLEMINKTVSELDLEKKVEVFYSEKCRYQICIGSSGGSSSSKNSICTVRWCVNLLDALKNTKEEKMRVKRLLVAD